MAGGSHALTGAARGLEPGAPADIVSLNTGHPALLERGGDALIDSWIFTAGREAIDCVWRHGRQWVREGRHVHRETVAARYRKTLRKLLA